MFQKKDRAGRPGILFFNWGDQTNVKCSPEPERLTGWLWQSDSNLLDQKNGPIFLGESGLQSSHIWNSWKCLQRLSQVSHVRIQWNSHCQSLYIPVSPPNPTSWCFFPRTWIRGRAKTTPKDPKAQLAQLAQLSAYGEMAYQPRPPVGGVPIHQSWYPLVMSTVCYWKWPSRNSEFSREKCMVDLSIVMGQFTRG